MSWQGRAEEAAQTRPDGGVLREAAGVPDWDGSLRQFASLGQKTPRFRTYGAIDGPQFIKPYVKTNKNDVADAEAICEAVARPDMRFVSVKSVEQQAVLSLHRVRQSFVKARTAQPTRSVACSASSAW
jgi:hypothetical protein